MHPDIQKRFDDLETRRKALVDRVRSMPSEKQKQPGPSKGFSPLETVMHFAIAEAGNNQFLKKAPPSTLTGRKVKHGFAFGGTMKGMAEPSKQMFSPPMFVPKGTFTVDEADKAWEAARKELGSYLEQAKNPDDAFIKMMFLFGTLSASDYIAFTEAHMSYHEARVRK